jgi:hypothetical protein
MLEKGFISGTHVFGRQQTRCDFMSLLIYLRLMDNLHVRLIFGLGKKKRIPVKNLLILVKLQNLVIRNVVKYGKYSLAKFAYFEYVCILRAEIVTIFELKMVTISARNKHIQNLQGLYISKLYIISQPNFAILLISLGSL